MDLALQDMHIAIFIVRRDANMAKQIQKSFWMPGVSVCTCSQFDHEEIPSLPCY